LFKNKLRFESPLSQQTVRAYPDIKKPVDPRRGAVRESDARSQTRH
jgi:hypothetical protein